MSLIIRCFVSYSIKNVHNTWINVPSLFLGEKSFLEHMPCFSRLYLLPMTCKSINFGKPSLKQLLMHIPKHSKKRSSCSVYIIPSKLNAVEFICLLFPFYLIIPIPFLALKALTCEPEEQRKVTLKIIITTASCSMSQSLRWSLFILLPLPLSFCPAPWL